MIRIGRNYIKSLAAKATRSSTFCKVNFREHTFTAHYCTNSAMNVSTPHWIVCHSRPSTAVGYVTTEVKKSGGKSFAVQLTDLSGGESVAINELIKGNTLTYHNSNFNYMDQIWVYNKGWVKYCYKGSSKTNAAWKRYNANGATTAEKYLDLVSTDVVSNGWTFLYYNKGNKSQNVTLSGKVVEFEAQPSYTVAKSGGQFIAYPWPVDFPISLLSTCCTSLTYHNSNFNYMDQAWIYDAGWKKYCFKGSSASNAVWKRYNANGATAAEKYLDVDDKVDYVQAGQGFLFYNKGNKAKTITFTFSN